MNRKDFLKTSLYLGAGLPFIGCLSDKTQTGAEESNWKDGDVAHILPTVNHNRMLISTSFKRVINEPILKVGKQSFKGQMRDSKGYFWAFDCANLQSETEYNLRLFEKAEPLCDAWPLKTFPTPNTDMAQLKLMVYTCAGGHPKGQDFMPVPENMRESPEHFAKKRVALLNRGLSFKPDALVIIGDTIYWDLNGNGKGRLGTSTHEGAIALVGKFDESKPILGTANEEVLKKAVSPQIIDLYGTASRSTPVFIFKDDHDYWENDEASDALITFPPKNFQLELGRIVQQMYYPSFLPDEERPMDLPGTGAIDRPSNVSESFGTLRYGRLAELLMYDCRRFVTLAGEKAQFLPAAAENWLHSRTASQEVKHTLHVPSTPFGWSAGKWLEWYPDFLGKDGKLQDDLNKPYWQKGWLLQHDRILQNMYEAKHKKPIMISGDLHAFASGRIYQNGATNLEDNPIHCFLSGPLGNTVFPSIFRKTKAAIPTAIKIEEDFENEEENGFSMVEIDAQSVQIKMYKYLFSRDNLDTIPTLQSFQNLKV